MPQSESNRNEYLDYLGEISHCGRTMLLPALLEAQKRFTYIPKDIAAAIGVALKVPLADVTGMIGFYSMLYPEKTGDTVIRVCTSSICSAQGGRLLHQELLSDFGINNASATPDRKLFIEKVECLGLCDQAPASLVGETAVGQASPESLLENKNSYQTLVYGEEQIVTKRIGKIDPISLDDYLAHDGFVGLRNALDIESDYICDFMENSGLLGRGGAAFVTRRKWEGAASADGEPKYIVCNADESEPGTFKDRVLLENDPYAILEGMLIAGFAIGAEKGFIYIRGEYPRAQKIFAQVIEEARERGYLGEDILDSGFSFDVEMRSGAGAYICGEETALFESIEGKRGFPRLKPPYPTTHGLFRKPTVINNVETFANVSLMLRIGVEKYCTYGTPQSSGPWLFCLSGEIEKPGLYEVAHPVTLRALIQSAGGLKDGAELQTVLLGGAAGKFVHPDQLDVRLTQEDTRAAGLTLGSGAVIVLRKSTDLKQILSDLGHFFAHESCGKCYPCQLGTQRQSEILDRILAGETIPDDFVRLEDVGWTMLDASICGLGQTAASAVLSAMEIWPELFE
ncbi:NAD(P)H-dependent oxidoreductase subunit E [Chloroflexota bacterium]